MRDFGRRSADSAALAGAAKTGFAPGQQAAGWRMAVWLGRFCELKIEALFPAGLSREQELRDQSRFFVSNQLSTRTQRCVIISLPGD